MTEGSAFAVQKRGARWCVIHAESGIMHERNFSHKGMAKLFGMELTESGFVPKGADRVQDILAEEVEKAEKHKEALARMEEKKVLKVSESVYNDVESLVERQKEANARMEEKLKARESNYGEPAQKAPKKYRKRRKKNK